MRHAPFAIGPHERDAWLARMREAIAWTNPSPTVAEQLNAYFDMAAEAMRNRDAE
jgi:hemoglobin